MLPFWESAALTLSRTGLGSLRGVLSARLMFIVQVLGAALVWFITTLSSALLLLSQSSGANKTFRHRAVCIIRLMIESMLGCINSSFQSNAGALLEHSAV